MFKFKKKIKQGPVQFSYSNWEQDFGFLTLVLARHVNMNKEFYIKIYASQLDGLDTLKERDLKQAHEDIVYNIYTTFSENYVNLLVSKSFASKEKLIEFISDNVYVELLKSAEGENKEKIKKIQIKNRLNSIRRANERNKKEQSSRS